MPPHPSPPPQRRIKPPPNSTDASDHAQSPLEKERQSGSGGANQQLSQRARRCSRHDTSTTARAPAGVVAAVSSGQAEHIDRVARFAAEDSEVEEILLKLLRITRNHERWGFLSTDDPHHPYYSCNVAEQRRGKRAPTSDPSRLSRRRHHQLLPRVSTCIYAYSSRWRPRI